MKEKPSKYIKLAVIYVVMAVVYIYIIHPFLLDVAPFLTFQSSEGFDRHSGGLGPFTLVAGAFIYYIAIEYTIKVGFIPFLANTTRWSLIFIPNSFLPERLHPENMKDLAELEKRYAERPGFIKRSLSYIWKIVSRRK